MIQVFDKWQQQLADGIEPTTNNVGHFINQIYLASGGLASDNNLSVDNEANNLNLLQRIAKEAKESTTGADASVSGGKYGDTALGSGFYNSPAYVMQHYTQLGKFFGGAEAGNKYTDHYKVPQNTPPAPSTSPDEFYAKWAAKMRQFAIAEEAINTGAAEIRTR